jgi:hypothetical protein
MSEELQQTQAPAADAVQLQLADLLLAAQVIQLASQRGAIKPEEFTQVGGLYERLVKFLQASGALQSAPQADAPAGEQATAAPEAPAAE